MERYIDIPEEIRDIYRIWRPTPLIRATGLEKALGLRDDQRIFFKYEGVSPAGSHKPQHGRRPGLLQQARRASSASPPRPAPASGAARCRWPARCSASSCIVYMVKVSYHQKPYRRVHDGALAAPPCFASPTDHTDAGRKALAADPDTPGSLGIAISEAVEDVMAHPGSKYALGSVLNHVLLHQTVIGEEAIEQVGAADAYPDVVIGCVGGGSSFAGIAFPFLREKLAGKAKTRFVGVEPTACPSLTKGVFAYDFGDVAQTTPLLKMYTLGPRLHAGRHPRRRPALPRHGAAHQPRLPPRPDGGGGRAPDQGLRGGPAVRADRGHRAGARVAPTPSARPSTRPSRPRKRAKPKTILFNLTGHGFLDLGAYEQPTSPASSRTTTTPRRPSRSPWSTCRRLTAAGRSVTQAKARRAGGADAPPARFLVPSRERWRHRAPEPRVAARPTRTRDRGGHARPEALPRGPARRRRPRRGVAAGPAATPDGRPLDPAHRLRRPGRHELPADVWSQDFPGRVAGSTADRRAGALGRPQFAGLRPHAPTSTPSRRPSPAAASR